MYQQVAPMEIYVKTPNNNTGETGNRPHSNSCNMTAFCAYLFRLTGTRHGTYHADNDWQAWAGWLLVLRWPADLYTAIPTPNIDSRPFGVPPSRLPIATLSLSTVEPWLYGNVCGRHLGLMYWVCTDVAGTVSELRSCVKPRWTSWALCPLIVLMDSVDVKQH